MDLGGLSAFVAVARAKGFRDGARASGGGASGLSEAVRRLETTIGFRHGGIWRTFGATVELRPASST